MASGEEFGAFEKIIRDVGVVVRCAISQIQMMRLLRYHSLSKKRGFGRVRVWDGVVRARAT